MCFNEKVSMLTYIIGITGCINLYFNLNLKIEAIFFAWVVQMQLIEYILWNNQSCNQLNINTTKLGIIINHLEPIILWIAILLLSTHKLPEYVNMLMIIFTLVTIIYTKNVLLNKCTLTEKKHLVWNWNHEKNSNIYYGFFIIMLNLLFINGVDNGNILALLSTGSFFISKLLYTNEKSVGAMWCFFSAFAPWIIPMVTSH